ncbi:MAG: type II toxin-antitoxin system antitoxin, RelB/DinJ family [Coriobacteriales bacterium]|nr:type II toxin-antitoxin system antitoxin, RelB/DinJ family [Coriobacteriales bacterium]
MALTEAINVFLRKSVTVGGLLFDVRRAPLQRRDGGGDRRGPRHHERQGPGDSFDSATDMFAALEE